MKKSIFFCSIGLLLPSFIIAQVIKANVYELGKGLIFKKEYNSLSYLYDELYVAVPIVEGIDNYMFIDKTGIIDKNEQVIVPFEYRNFHIIESESKNEYNKDLVQIYINKQGSGLYKLNRNLFENYFSPNHIEYKQNWLDPSILIVSDFNRQHLLDLKTKSLIRTNAERIIPLNKNLYSFKDIDKRKYGVFNNQLDTILRPYFSYIYTDEDNSYIYPELEQDNQKGVLDSLGRMLLPPIFKNVSVVNDLLCATTYNNKIRTKLSTKDIEAIKKMVVKYPIKDKLFKRVQKRKVKQNGLTGAFDLQGKIKIPFKYDYFLTGLNGQIIAVKDNKYYILNTKGKKVFKRSFSKISVVLERFYHVVSNKVEGLYTDEGEDFLPLENQEILVLSKFKVAFLKDNTWYLWDMVNKPQKTTLPSNYHLSRLSTPQSNKQQEIFYEIKSDGKYGVVDNNLHIIIPPIHKNTPSLNLNKYFSFDKEISYTLRGTTLIDYDLSETGHYDKELSLGTIICKKGDKFGVVNQFGSIVIPFEYKEIYSANENQFVVYK